LKGSGEKGRGPKEKKGSEGTLDKQGMMASGGKNNAFSRKPRGQSYTALWERSPQKED